MSAFRDRITVQGARPERFPGIESAFEKLGLPLPEDDEFLKGHMGALLFLDAYGVIVRVEFNDKALGDRRRIIDPCILQPLGKITTRKMVVAIYPGVERAVTGDERYLKRILESRGIDFWDDQEDNVGRLPVKMPGFPRGVPVVVDVAGAGEFFKGSIYTLGPIKRKNNRSCVLQNKLYGRLKKVFRRAIASGDPKIMREFWKLCAKEKKNGVLCSSWTKARPDQKAKPEYGRNYARHLKAVGFSA